MRHDAEDTRYGMAWKEAKWAETWGGVACPGANHDELADTADLERYACLYCGAAL